MKKLLLVVFAFLGITTYTYADKLYYTVVTVKVEYYYHKHYEEVGNYSGTTEFQRIEVCASSPDDAREKAKDQCERMCSGDQRVGNGNWNGESLPKYKRRSVYDVDVSAVGGDC